MIRILALVAVLLGSWTPLVHAERGSCPRKVAVRAFSESDPGFNSAVFLESYRQVFQSPGIELSESFAEPEYVLTATFEKEGRNPPRTYLAVILGFAEGEYGAGSSIGNSRFPFRTHYFGSLLEAAWNIAPGDSPADHLQLITAEFAAKGGLEKIMREYEQIPVTAAAELAKDAYADNECLEHREERYIDIVNFKSGYAERFTYPPEIRLVAHVEKGEILNGEPLQGQEKSRVYTIDASRGVARSISVRYRAPAEGETDRLIIENSCDILPPIYKPLKDTDRKDEILSYDIPLCIDWEGTIEYRWSAVSAKGVLPTSVLPGGEYQSSENSAAPGQIRERPGHRGLRGLRLDLGPCF